MSNVKGDTNPLLCRRDFVFPIVFLSLLLFLESYVASTISLHISSAYYLVEAIVAAVAAILIVLGLSRLRAGKGFINSSFFSLMTVFATFLYIALFVLLEPLDNIIIAFVTSAGISIATIVAISWLKVGKGQTRWLTHYTVALLAWFMVFPIPYTIARCMLGLAECSI